MNIETNQDPTKHYSSEDLNASQRTVLLVNFYEVTIHTLPHLKCMRLVTVGSSHIPFNPPPPSDAVRKQKNLF